MVERKKAIPTTQCSPRIFVGTGAIAYKEWKGKFYPKDLPATQALDFYARTFSSLELNNTFYRMPVPLQMKELVTGLPSQFPVAVKVPQLITHIKRLKKISGPTKIFFRAISALKKQQGAALLQLPPNFKIDLDRLENFFKSVPAGFRVAVEFRHASWFVEPVFKFLRAQQAALVYNDTDVKDMPFLSTAEWGYIRLRRLRYSKKELTEWTKKIKAQKWKDAFVIFKHEEKVTAPKLARRFQDLVDPIPAR